MALISIILGLIFDRLFRHLHDLRDLSWFEYYARRIAWMFRFVYGPMQLVLVLLLPVLLVAVIQFLLYGILFNLPYLVFGIMVFAFCLGPACLSSELEIYIDARRMGDEDEAMHYAGALTERAASTSPDQQTSDVTRAILHAASERIFSVIFWFVLLGPVGALLYRLVTNTSKQDELNDNLLYAATLIQALMSWVPARMLALGYAFTGHFEGALQAYRNRPYEPDIGLENDDVLINTGIGALRDFESTDELSSILAARNLVMRAIMVWIAVLAVMTLGGWLS